MTASDLRKAIKHGDLKTAKAILKEGGAAFAFPKGWSALHLTCKAGQLEIVRALLEHKANVNAQTDLFRTALDEAVRYRHEDIAKLLREAGGRHGFELNLAGAIGDQDLRWVKKHLSAGAELNAPFGGELPICLALRFRGQEVLNYLLRKKPDVRKAQQGGETPLHIAVRSHSSEPTLVKLLRLGADVNARDDEGITPLAAAARAENEEAVDFLLQHGANVKLGGHGWNSPVSMALSQANQEIAHLLIDHGALSDLHQAVHCGHLAQVEKLLREGADIESTDTWGSRTPLQIAVEQEHPDVAQFLLESKADPNVQEAFSYGADTPLHDAVRLGSAKMVKLLLAHGADPDLQNAERLTPLEVAKRRNFGHLVRIMDAHIDRQLQLKAVEQLYTVHKVTELLSVDEAFVMRLVKSGKLRQVHLDAQTPRIPESSLSRYLASLQP